MNIKIKTSTLIGPALDWAVAKCEYTDRRVEIHEMGGIRVENAPGSGEVWGFGWFNFRSSTDHGQGGPIIERESIELRINMDGDWQGLRAYAGRPAAVQSGPTMLIAGMRCYVASKLGAEVDVPEELL